MSGFLARRSEDVDDLLARDRLRDDLPNDVVDVAQAFPVADLRLGDGRAHGLEEADIIPDADRLVVRHGERERFGELGDDLK